MAQSRRSRQPGTRPARAVRTGSQRRAAPDISDWESQRQQLLQAVDTLDGELLETLFNRSMALYPTSVCITELWQPVIEQLEERWSGQFGAELQRRQLESFLRTRIGMRLYHANHVTGGARLLLVPY